MIREIFIKGTKKNKIFKTAVIIILCYFIVMLGWTIISSGIRMYIDFPCFVHISDDGCFVGQPYERVEVETKNIEVYLSTYLAYASGGGCLYKVSDTNEVKVKNHLFQKEGENLIIDDKITLKKGEEWKNVKVISFWNPWRLTKEKISVKNYGIITCAEDLRTRNITSYGPTLIAIGSTRTYYEINYIGILVFIVLIGLLVYSHVYSKRTLEQKSYPRNSRSLCPLGANALAQQRLRGLCCLRQVAPNFHFVKTSLNRVLCEIVPFRKSNKNCKMTGG